METENKPTYWLGLADYDYMTGSSGYSDYCVRLAATLGQVLFAANIGKWTGDVIVALYRDSQFGWLEMSYGSCSGCDEIAGIIERDDGAAREQRLHELQQKLNDEIKWFPSALELAKHLESRDWDGSHLPYINGDDGDKLRQFIRRAVDFLKKGAGVK